MVRIYSTSLFLVLFTAFFISSCNNDLELIGDKVEVPIVYGTISVTDPFVFIRLERAFGDNLISPTVLAKRADSLYYNNAQVFISIPEDNFKVELIKVDAETLGFPRDTGVFATQPNFIYKVDKNNFIFKPGAKYLLEIIIAGRVHTSNTLLINEIEMLNPRPDKPVLWNPRVNETTSQSPQIQYNPLGDNRNADPAIMSMTIRFNYNERDINVSPEYSKKSLLIPIVKSVIPADDYRFRYSATQIFAAIGENLVASPTVDRYFTSADFIITSGGKEFASYNEALAANAGITGTQDFPVFSNIDGGFGIFSSKNTQEFKDYYLADATLDSLSVGRFTSSLNFRK